MSMDQRLVDCRDVWDEFGRLDPLWAILSSPAMRGRRWQLTDFMKNGEREAALLFHELQRLGTSIETCSAVDFGCGVGRVTQALARRFARVLGIDISPAMIDMANRINLYPGVVNYVVNVADDLDIVPSGSTDLVYSNIVLQHIPSDLAKRYIREFFRILSRDGVAVFQVPSHPPSAQEVIIRPMRDDAYRTKLALVGQVHESLSAGKSVSLQVEVINVTDHDWSQADVGSIRIGNHWLSATGERMLVQDDGRTPLPQLVRAGQGCSLSLEIRPPLELGSYCLEVDLVHEGVTWFGDKGSLTHRSPVRVVAGPDALPGGAVDAIIQEQAVPAYDMVLPPPPSNIKAVRSPVFPMYGIPQREVLDLVESCGARLIHIEEDRRARPEWVGYIYFAKKND